MDTNNNDIFKFIGKQIRDLRKSRNISIEGLSLKIYMAEGLMNVIKAFLLPTITNERKS